MKVLNVLQELWNHVPRFAKILITAAIVLLLLRLIGYMQHDGGTPLDAR